jgi:long-chain acyl-CoA synthetase
MPESVLLTGATGNLGTWLARRLLAEPDLVVIALVRAADPEEASRRLARAWWDERELVSAIGTRIEPVAGDVARPDLGLDPTTLAALVRRTTLVIHAAADLRLDAPLKGLRRTNVTGTANVLEFARAVNSDHGLVRFVHVSTAYVCGRRRGEILEEGLSAADGFANAYEQTKFEAESLVRGAMSDLPVSVVRPVMIVGDSRTGAIATFNTVYGPLLRYLTGRLPLVPAGRGQRLDLVPVDWVADAVVRVAFDPRASGQTFHLAAPAGSGPTLGDVFDVAREFAREHLGVGLPPARFVPFARDALGSDRLGRMVLGRARLLLPYVDEGRVFRRDNVERLLGHEKVDWEAILPRLLAYAAARGFLHRSERTVHEQILFRLERASRPVSYGDVVEGHVFPRTAREVHAEILAAAGALRAFGIEPGDRVAIVGLNSTRYLALDVAIGLVGAVSVPLYYTSPPADIDAILAASGARLLLVGAPAVIARLDELKSEVPIVAFGQTAVPLGLRRPVTAWEDLVAGGGVSRMPDGMAPIGFDDPATIRYTSGTTGRPKGVVFTHGQLRWMAQTMAGLLPWRTRTRPVRYLSFLPLNHVVEGILATYAAYYLPAPVAVTYLEDFRGLQAALPRVRPTAFFSVPRVFEKAWEGLEASRIGRAYLRSSHGPLRDAMRPVVRRGLLRRLGLEQCGQIIVGSAPAETSLLEAFRELGIELHDAYGLTEAPLVTLNRSGANRIGTVGESLPETELRIADDGEILVRGPQVTAGYFERDLESPVCDGWLHTGDLGSLTADGWLVIRGRKKELLATSYGKKIFPARVEALLRTLPGVAEAMLVGEGRPYCAAILWSPDVQVAERTVAVGIAAVNARVSHPEQVRRWIVLRNDLSIERGDLTANLKLRRGAVEARLAETVEALYADGVDGATAPRLEALHIGQAATDARVHAGVAR